MVKSKRIYPSIFHPLNKLRQINLTPVKCSTCDEIILRNRPSPDINYKCFNCKQIAKRKVTKLAYLKSKHAHRKTKKGS